MPDSEDNPDDLHTYVGEGPTEFLSAADQEQTQKVIQTLGREFRHMNRRVNDTSRRQLILEEQLTKVDRLEKIVFRGNGEDSLRERIVRIEADQSRDRDDFRAVKAELSAVRTEFHGLRKELQEFQTKTVGDRVKETSLPLSVIGLILVEVLKYAGIIPVQ